MHWLLVFILICCPVACTHPFDCTPPEPFVSWLPDRGALEAFELRKKLSQSPSDLNLRLSLTSHYIQTRLKKRAKPLLNSLMDLAPSHPEVWILHSRYSVLEQNYNKALVEAFRALLLSNSESETICFEHAHLQLINKNPVKAIQFADYALQKHNSDRLRWVRTMALIELQQWGEAEQALILLRKNLPDFAPLSINLALLSCRLNDEDSILFNLRKASLQGYMDSHRLELDPCLNPHLKKTSLIAVLNLIKKNHEMQRITPGLQKL